MVVFCYFSRKQQKEIANPLAGGKYQWNTIVRDIEQGRGTANSQSGNSERKRAGQGNCKQLERAYKPARCQLLTSQDLGPRTYRATERQEAGIHQGHASWDTDTSLFRFTKLLMVLFLSLIRFTKLLMVLFLSLIRFTKLLMVLFLSLIHLAVILLK